MQVFGTKIKKSLEFLTPLDLYVATPGTLTWAHPLYWPRETGVEYNFDESQPPHS